MNDLKRTIAAALALASTAPAVAAGILSDGRLPMYPNGKLDPKEASLTPAAIAHGVPLVLLTNDAVSVVTAWYATHQPGGCSRQDASGATRFACPGGSIMIYAHDGRTQIALVPPLGI